MDGNPEYVQTKYKKTFQRAFKFSEYNSIPEMLREFAEDIREANSNAVNKVKGTGRYSDPDSEADIFNPELTGKYFKPGNKKVHGLIPDYYGRSVSRKVDNTLKPNTIHIDNLWDDDDQEFHVKLVAKDIFSGYIVSSGESKMKRGDSVKKKSKKKKKK